MQSLFGDEQFRRDLDVNIYHDESGGGDKTRSWLVQGVLFVPTHYHTAALAILAYARHGFTGEIHFSSLRENNRHNQREAEVAKTWLGLFTSSLAEHCCFNCVVIDKTSDYYQNLLRRDSNYPYNHSTMMTIYGGITWFYKGYDLLKISIFSDHRVLSPDNNFCQYLPAQVAKKAAEKRSKPTDNKCPHIELGQRDVQMVNSKPSQVCSQHIEQCEFIQLTDLLTSAVAQAIIAGAEREIKAILAELMASYMIDTSLPPWLQAMGLHRRLSVKCFPDQYGGFYDCPKPIVNRNQMSFLKEL